MRDVTIQLEHGVGATRAVDGERRGSSSSSTRAEYRVSSIEYARAEHPVECKSHGPSCPSEL
ncbi:MAG: hypothetical protein ABGY24_10335 [bacterium]